MILSFKKQNNIKIIFILIILTLKIAYKKIDEKTINKLLGKNNIYKLRDITNLTMNNKTILILETHHYHSECSPGFSKYLIDLGYNVDIMMNIYGKDAFNLFEFKDKIRIILYNYPQEINIENTQLNNFFSKYSSIIIETVDPRMIDFIYHLDLLCNKNIYVFHIKDFYDKMNFSEIQNQNRIWTLGHFSIGLYVNPHYFGKIKLKNKNKKTRFFIVSSMNRNYNYLVSASQKLIEENYDFDVIVTGRTKTFNINNINQSLINNFIFSYYLNFSELYNAVDSSDYIIISLDPDNKNDLIFKNKRVTGSIQLSYGFKKPVLIDSYFSDAYNMTKSNSFLFRKINFYEVMKEAINLNNEKYKIMQKNLIKLSNLIYNDSLQNVKKTLNSLLYKF